MNHPFPTFAIFESQNKLLWAYFFLGKLVLAGRSAGRAPRPGPFVIRGPFCLLQFCVCPDRRPLSLRPGGHGTSLAKHIENGSGCKICLFWHGGEAAGGRGGPATPPSSFPQTLPTFLSLSSRLASRVFERLPPPPHHVGKICGLNRQVCLAKRVFFPLPPNPPAPPLLHLARVMHRCSYRAVWQGYAPSGRIQRKVFNWYPEFFLGSELQIQWNGLCRGGGGDFKIWRQLWVISQQRKH